MSRFEIVTVILSFVLGLSMSHLLWSTTSAVRARQELRLHWLPFVWAASIFLAHVEFWFAVLSIDLVIDLWTWSWILSALSLSALLFASGALVLPSAFQRSTGELISDFREHGRLALIPLAIYFILWIPVNYRLGRGLLTIGHLVNVILCVTALLGLRTRNPRTQAAAAVVFLIVFAWSAFFVWAEEPFW